MELDSALGLLFHFHFMAQCYVGLMVTDLTIRHDKARPDLPAQTAINHAWVPAALRNSAGGSPSSAGAGESAVGNFGEESWAVWAFKILLLLPSLGLPADSPWIYVS